MSDSGFQGLLDWLSADPGSAGEMYEAIRNALICFFEVRQVGNHADELTDLVFDVVGRKLLKGDQLPVDSPRAYLLGVARNVLRDHWKKPGTEVLPPDEARSPENGIQPSRTEKRRKVQQWEESIDKEASQKEEEERLKCLDDCLQRLPAESRSLILDYYREEKRTKIATRKRLAAHLGISPNSLAIRTCRTRKQLEQCVLNCLKLSK